MFSVSLLIVSLRSSTNPATPRTMSIFMTINFFKFFCFVLFIFERKNVSRKGSGRGGQRIWSRPCTDSSEPDVGLEHINHEPWPELKVAAQLTEPPRRPIMTINLNSLLGMLLISVSLSSLVDFVLYFHLEHTPLSSHFVSLCFYVLGKSDTFPAHESSGLGQLGGSVG